MSPGQGAEAQPSLVLWASVRGDSLGDRASGGRQPGCHHGEGVPGCLQRAQGQLPQATCEAVRESSLGLCLPQASGTLPPRTHRGTRGREGPGPEVAWEPRAAHTCVTWGLLCAPPGSTHSVDTPHPASLTRPAAGWPRPPPGQRSDSRAPAPRSRARDSGAWSERLPARLWWWLIGAFTWGGIPGSV